jgi:hypothetical protein
VFEYPTQAMRDEYTANGVIPYIVGAENNEEDGTGTTINWIMSNRQRSEQRLESREYKEFFTHFDG